MVLNGLQRRLSFLCLILPVCATVVYAQDDPPADPPAQETRADSAEILLGEFRVFAESYNRRGRLTAADYDTLETLVERYEAYLGANEPAERLLAAGVQLARWLQDPAAARRLLPHFETVDTQHPGLRIIWAEELRNAARYRRAVSVLDAIEFDLRQFPLAAALRADCLARDNHFDDAEATLNAIPSDLRLRSEVLGLVESVRSRITSNREFWPEELAIRAAEAAADDLPRVEMETEHGMIILELFENEAPNTVANFVSLAEAGFYDGTRFHRIVPGFVTQGGDPKSRDGITPDVGDGGPGYRIRDEVEISQFRRHFAGSLSMAKTEAPDTGGSQFFITHTQAPHLNGVHTVFGRVIEGIEVARRMEVGDRVIAVRVVRKRDHAYQPETLPDPNATPPAAPDGGDGGDGADGTDGGDGDGSDGDGATL